jgi:hypothetical protein
MDARRLARSVFLLLWVTLVGMHPLMGAPEPADHSATQQSFISGPRQSLPPPVHDEATCAFCQAAAFAPHNPGTATATIAAIGPERRETLSQDYQIIRAGSARQPRSRGPPALPNV